MRRFGHARVWGKSVLGVKSLAGAALVGLKLDRKAGVGVEVKGAAGQVLQGLVGCGRGLAFPHGRVLKQLPLACMWMMTAFTPKLSYKNYVN